MSIRMQFTCDRCGEIKIDTVKTEVPFGWAVWEPIRSGDAHPHTFILCARCHQAAPWRVVEPARAEEGTQQ